MPDQGRPDPRLGQAGRHPCPRLADPGGLLARREPRPRPQPHRQGRGLPARARHRRPGPADHVAGGRDTALRGADPPRRGHDLGHRQRPARLQHRPVPDPRAGHLGQDALGRAADERRRPVRDRRGRLGSQARAATGRRELPALGQPRRVPRARGVVPARGGQGQRAGTGARRHPRPRHRDPAQREQVPGAAGSARSTTGAATSGWPATGPRSWLLRPRTPSSLPCSPPWPSSWSRSPRRSTPS